MLVNWRQVETDHVSDLSSQSPSELLRKKNSNLTFFQELDGSFSASKNINRGKIIVNQMLLRLLKVR